MDGSVLDGNILTERMTAQESVMKSPCKDVHRGGGTSYRPSEELSDGSARPSMCRNTLEFDFLPRNATIEDDNRARIRENAEAASARTAKNWVFIMLVV